MKNYETNTKLKNPGIPKSREIFVGDINDAVIKVQQVTGFEVTPEWWMSEVGNEGATEDILDRFDRAFEQFIHLQMSTAESSEVENATISEADKQLDEFDQAMPKTEADVQLREEFLEELAEHLKEKYCSEKPEVVGTDPRDQILLSGSVEYLAAEQARKELEDPVTRIVELHYSSEGREITLLGTNHTFDPDDPGIAYLDSFVREKASNPRTVFILEGQYSKTEAPMTNPVDAVITGGEFNYTASLANQLGVEYIPAEPDPRTNAEQILVENPEITREEVALHYTVKTLSALFKDQDEQPLADISPYVYCSAGIGGTTEDGGVVEKSFSRTDILEISDDLRGKINLAMPQLIEQLNEVFIKVVPGETLLELIDDDVVKLVYNLNSQPVLWDPAPELSNREPTVITKISQLDMLMRDRHTFSLMQQALDEGKEPVVAVGSSHVSTLGPAMDAAYKKSEEQ